MNCEQIEAKVLSIVKPRRLFGCGDYILTESELLSLVRMVHTAGMAEQSGRTAQMMNDALNVRIVS